MDCYYSVCKQILNCTYCRSSYADYAGKRSGCIGLGYFMSGNISLPMILLGMVSPYLVKLGVEDTDNKGVSQVRYMPWNYRKHYRNICSHLPYNSLQAPVRLFTLCSAVKHSMCPLLYLYQKNALRNTITAILILVLCYSPSITPMRFGKIIYYTRGNPYIIIFRWRNRYLYNIINKCRFRSPVYL